jgi:hypothetical protein
MTDIKQSVWNEFIVERIDQVEKILTSAAWKKAILPWLQAHREMKIRAVLQSDNHSQIDRDRGFVLAFEQLINLGKAIEFERTQQSNKSTTPQPHSPQPNLTSWADGLPDFPLIDEDIQ